MSKKNSIPDPLAPWSEKIKDDYGLSYAYMIGKDWFNNGMASGGEHSTRKAKIKAKRKFVRGEQDGQSYKDHIARQEGDLEYLNLDWSNINIQRKFCDIVSNGIDEKHYKLDIRANDKLSMLEKQKKVKEHLKNMRALPLMKQAKEAFGIDLTPNGFIPENEEELQFYSEIKDRPKAEIGEEIMINYVKQSNRWSSINIKKNRDLVAIGGTAARVFTDSKNGIVIEYADLENMIHSYVKENDFSDADYFGEVDSTTIHELRRGGKFNDAQLRKIAKQYAKESKISVPSFETCLIEDIFNINVDILKFTFKTFKEDIYKGYKRNGKLIKARRKSEDFEVNRSEYTKIKGGAMTWMEGIHIIDSEFIYDYGECENLVRDEQDKPLPPYIVIATNIYENRLDAFTDVIEPLANQMQYFHLKIQHLAAELKPDLIEIDLDSLADLSEDTKDDEEEGTSKQATWKSALNILNVKGVVLKKRVDMGEMGMKDTPAARPTGSQQGSALTALLNLWAHYYNLTRENTGVNPARDGSLPHDALLGVNQMAQLASNTATKHIVDASIEFDKRVCETISSRLKRIFANKNAQHLVKMYERAVGKENVEAIEPLKNRQLLDFGFTVEMNPTQQEIASFNEDLRLALQDGSIDVEIKAEAEAFSKVSFKQARQYLFFMRRKRRKEMMQDEAQRAKIKSQNDSMAARAAKTAEAESYAYKKQVDLKFEAQKIKLELAKEQALIQIKAPVNDKEFQQEVYLRQIDVIGDYKMKGIMEDRKDERTKIQATQQSKMKAQGEGPPINFEKEDFGNIFGKNNSI